MNERKERQITVRLSDEDCTSLMNKCGEHGITINELFENFAGDLAGGSYTNGSDERMLANKWFDRCWFGLFPQKTLLNHLLYWGNDPEEYFELICQLDTAIKETDYLSTHPEEQEPGDIEYFTTMVAECQGVIRSVTDEWEPEEISDLTEEIHRIACWIDQKNQFIDRPGTQKMCEEELKTIDLEKVFSELEITKENDMEECYTLPTG